MPNPLTEPTPGYTVNPLDPYDRWNVRPLYMGPVGSSQVGGDTSLSMPSPDVSPVVGWYGQHPVTAATRSNALDIASTLSQFGPADVAAIRGFHGSPHLFAPTPHNPLGEFDPMKIGTGEGNQAFGVGAGYIAEREGVARTYKNVGRSLDYTTSSGGTIPDWIGNSIKQIGDQFGTDSELYGQTIDRHIADFQGRIAEERARLADPDMPQPWLTQERIDTLTKNVADLQKLRSGDATLNPRGHMYEVDIHADPEHFLDWDKPLSEQSQHVQGALAKLNVPNAPHVTGEMAYTHLQGEAARERDMLNKVFRDRAASGDTREFPDDAARLALVNHPPSAASTDLQKAGIAGIRYLDAGSRGAGQGSHNYVVFSPDTIEILRRYGIAGLIGGTAAAGAASGGTGQEQ